MEPKPEDIFPASQHYHWVWLPWEGETAPWLNVLREQRPAALCLPTSQSDAASVKKSHSEHNISDKYRTFDNKRLPSCEQQVNHTSYSKRYWYKLIYKTGVKIAWLAKPKAFLTEMILKTAPLLVSIHGVSFFFVAGSRFTNVNISFAWIKKTSKNQSSCHLHRYLNLTYI